MIPGQKLPSSDGRLRLRRGCDRSRTPYLLNIGEVSATLIGLFLVGVFFYVESGLHRRMELAVSPSFRPSARRSRKEPYGTTTILPRV